MIFIIKTLNGNTKIKLKCNTYVKVISFHFWGLQLRFI